MSWVLRIWQSTVGKKAVMALTGLLLFGFVLGHLAGNLQIYIRDGGKSIDAYGAFLHSKPGLLWAARLGLLIAVALHIITSIQLTIRNRQARPVPYHVKQSRAATYASRTMMWSGPIIAFFVVYHLLHFTTGQAHPDFRHLEVHHNLITGFQSKAAVVIYVVAMLLLGFHLFHGAWSMFQSMGVNHPKYNPLLRGFAVVFAVVVTLGNVSMPLAVMLGLVK